MRLYFEIKNKDNDKCVPLPLLDKIVAKFFDGQCDKEKYFVPEGECVNWVDVCEGLLWANDLKVHRHAVDMRELSRQLTENGCLYDVKDKSLFLDLFRYFENINLYLFVVFLDQSMFAPRDENAWYMTTEPERKYAEKEIDDCLDNVISREIFVRNLKIVEYFKKESDEEKMWYEAMEEKEDAVLHGIGFWKHIEFMSEDSISDIQNKIDLVCTFIHRYDYYYLKISEKIGEARSLLIRLEQKMEMWRNIDNSGTEELGENKPVFLEQVRRREQEVSLDAMSQDAFVAKLKELLGHYSDLRIEDYRGWIKEDTYNKLFDVIFPL